MTCIIGLIENGVAYMGGDSAVSMGWTRDTLSTRKVFRVGEFLIGYSGDVRTANVLKHHLNIPVQTSGDADEKYIVCSFIEAVRKAVKELDHAQIKDGQLTLSSQFLVAYKAQLYSIGGDLSVVTVSGNLYACGSGYEVALGAMVALKKIEPIRRIKKSLKISAQFVSSVAAPFYVEMQGGNNAIRP